MKTKKQRRHSKLPQGAVTKFEAGRSYATRRGDRMRIVATNYPGSRPLVAVSTDGKTTRMYRADGRSADAKLSKLDLVAVWEPAQGFQPVIVAGPKFETRAEAELFVAAESPELLDADDFLIVDTRKLGA